MDPITGSITSGVGNTVSASITLARFIFEIKRTPNEVKACFALTRRVDEDLKYLIALRSKHLKHLLTIMNELNRLDRIIHATKESIFEVCRLLEACRAEAHEGNTIPFTSKMKWVLGDSGEFARLSANMVQQHAAINVEIGYLRQFDLLQPLADITTTTFENLELLSMVKKKSSSRLSKGVETDIIVSTVGQKSASSKRSPVFEVAKLEIPSDGEQTPQEEGAIPGEVIQRVHSPQNQFQPPTARGSSPTDHLQMSQYWEVELSTVSISPPSEHVQMAESPLDEPKSLAVAPGVTAESTTPFFAGSPPPNLIPDSELEDRSAEEAYFEDLKRQEERRARRHSTRLSANSSTDRVRDVSPFSTSDIRHNPNPLTSSEIGRNVSPFSPDDIGRGQLTNTVEEKEEEDPERCFYEDLRRQEEERRRRRAARRNQTVAELP